MSDLIAYKRSFQSHPEIWASVCELLDQAALLYSKLVISSVESNTLSQLSRLHHNDLSLRWRSFVEATDQVPHRIYIVFTSYLHSIYIVFCIYIVFT